MICNIASCFIVVWTADQFPDLKDRGWEKPQSPCQDPGWSDIPKDAWGCVEVGFLPGLPQLNLCLSFSKDLLEPAALQMQNIYNPSPKELSQRGGKGLDGKHCAELRASHGNVLAWDCISREGFSTWVGFLWGKACQNGSKEGKIWIWKASIRKREWRKS